MELAQLAAARPPSCLFDIDGTLLFDVAACRAGRRGRSSGRSPQHCGTAEPLRRRALQRHDRPRHRARPGSSALGRRRSTPALIDGDPRRLSRGCSPSELPRAAGSRSIPASTALLDALRRARRRRPSASARQPARGRAAQARARRPRRALRASAASAATTRSAPSCCASAPRAAPRGSACPLDALPRGRDRRHAARRRGGARDRRGVARRSATGGCAVDDAARGRARPGPSPT